MTETREVLNEFENLKYGETFRNVENLRSKFRKFRSVVKSVVKVPIRV